MEKLPFASLASTAKCFAALANGTLRALPDRLPSALTAIRSFGLAGTTVISPSGEAIPACASSQPASIVSASGTATAKRPAALSTLKPSARLAPEPPQSSGTQASGRPASVSACQSGAFHAPLSSRLMVWASARSAKIFSAVSATMFSLSATAFLVLYWHRLGPVMLPNLGAGLWIGHCADLGCGLFLRFMMRKSHSHDKRSPQGGLRQRHEGSPHQDPQE